MSEVGLYHEGNRELQDRFGSRALADRLEEKLARKGFDLFKDVVPPRQPTFEG